MLSLKLMPLSLESGRILKLWELTCPLLLCQKSAGTCMAHSAVVFPKGSTSLGREQAYVKGEDILIIVQVLQ